MENVETQVYKTKGGGTAFLAFIVGILIFLAELIVLFEFSLNFTQQILSVFIAILGYAICLIFIAEDRLIQQRITRTEVKEVKESEGVNFREYVQPVIRVKEVEKPVYIKSNVPDVVRKIYVEKPVIKKVYIERKRKKLNIPKYAFLGSTETRTFHKRVCRFGKLIKKKYKLSANTKSFFKKKRFKACKACLARRRKN